jgi:hypothetical protein
MDNSNALPTKEIGMVPQFFTDLAIASLIVAFSSSITYGVIDWFRKTKSKKQLV